MPIVNDWSRLRAGVVTYTMVGALQIAALIRYPGDFAWASLSGAYYLFFISSIFVIEIYSWIRMRRSLRTDPSN